MQYTYETAVQSIEQTQYVANVLLRDKSFLLHYFEVIPQLKNYRIMFRLGFSKLVAPNGLKPIGYLKSILTGVEYLSLRGKIE